MCRPAGHFEITSKDAAALPQREITTREPGTPEGAKTVMPPIDVPGGLSLARFTDPQRQSHRG